MAVSVKPDSKSAPIEEVAAFYAENLKDLREAEQWMYHAKRRLAEFIKDTGPIITKAGRVYLEASGTFEYPPEIVEEFPGLGWHVVTAVVDTKEQAERVLSLVSEEVPTAELDHKLKVDGKRAAAQIAKGGAAAHRVLDLRTAKASLAVES